MRTLTVIAKFVLIHYSTHALLSNIGYPDPSYGLPLLLQCFVHIVPKRFIELLPEISMELKIREDKSLCIQRTFGKPLAWAPMMVTAPGRRFDLSNGMYCFTWRYSVSSWLSNKAPGYSRTYWPASLCSLTLKCKVDIVTIGFGLCENQSEWLTSAEGERTLYTEEMGGYSM